MPHDCMGCDGSNDMASATYVAHMRDGSHITVRYCPDCANIVRAGDGDMVASIDRVYTVIAYSWKRGARGPRYIVESTDVGALVRYARGWTRDQSQDTGCHSAWVVRGPMEDDSHFADKDVVAVVVSGRVFPNRAEA